MFIKNITAYRINAAILPTHEQLSQFKFSECHPTQAHAYGWVAPIDSPEESLVYQGDGFLVLKAKKQVKKIPAPNLSEEINKRISTFEVRESRSLSKPEKAAIKDQAVTDLLPRAFPRDSFHTLIYFPKLQILVTDQNHNNSEALLGLLRKTLGSLPVVPAGFNHYPANVLTTWLKDRGEVPAGVELLDGVKLCDELETSVSMTTKNLDLDSEAVKEALKANFLVDQLAIEIPDVFTAVANFDGRLTKVRWDHVVTGANSEYEKENRPEQDLVLVAMTLAEFLPKWFDYFGGLYSD